MLDPESMRVFTAVVETGSFSEAGRQLELAPSSVSRHISSLEEALDVQLFVRTTRSMTLTETGQLFHSHATRILSDLREMRSLLHHADQTPTGTLRVSAPTVLGRMYVAPALLDYMQLYPDLSVELDLTDRLVDLVDQGVDVGVRIGQLPDSTLVARRLGPVRRLVCGSQQYFADKGIPQTPAQLIDHECITFHVHEVSPLWRASGQLWRFQGEDGLQEIAVNGNLRVNSADVLIQSALAGLGLILIVDWVAREHIESGQLIPVLTSYDAGPSTGDTGMFAVYPSGRHAPAKVRTFVDHLQASFNRLLLAGD